MVQKQHRFGSNKCLTCLVLHAILCHLSLSLSPKGIDKISNDGADIPDTADTACQKHRAIDGQVQMIKGCLKAKMTPSRCLACNIKY